MVRKRTADGACGMDSCRRTYPSLPVSPERLDCEQRQPGLGSHKERPVHGAGSADPVAVLEEPRERQAVRQILAAYSPLLPVLSACRGGSGTLTHTWHADAAEDGLLYSHDSDFPEGLKELSCRRRKKQKKTDG